MCFHDCAQDLDFLGGGGVLPIMAYTYIHVSNKSPPSGNVRIQKLIVKHIFQCFEKEEHGKVNTQGLLSP